MVHHAKVAVVGEAAAAEEEGATEIEMTTAVDPPGLTSKD